MRRALTAAGLVLLLCGGWCLATSAWAGTARAGSAPRSGHGAIETTCPAVPKAANGQVVVPIVVDFGTSRHEITATCVAVAKGSTGSDVLAARASLLHTAQPVYASSGLLCSIDGYPSTGCGTESGGHYAYWAYFHGGSKWTYANDGPAENTVGTGDVEGWRYEPDGTASAADPPPRAHSSVAALESAPPTTTTTKPTTTPTTTSTTTPAPKKTTTTRPPAAGSGQSPKPGGVHHTKGHSAGGHARSRGSTTVPGSTSNGAAVAGSSENAGNGSVSVSPAAALAPGHATRPASQVLRDVLLTMLAIVIVGGAAYAVIRSRRSAGAE